MQDVNLQLPLNCRFRSSSSSLKELDTSSSSSEADDDRKLSSTLSGSVSFPPIKVAKRVVLVRHGQSTWNAEGRIQGSSDFSILTQKGEAQAETSRQMLIDDSFDICFSSPLRRSKRTTEVIWGSRQEEILIDSDLREIDLYSFQGLLKHEGIEKYGPPFRQWQKDAPNFNIDGHYPRQLVTILTTMNTTGEYKIPVFKNYLLGTLGFAGGVVNVSPDDILLKKLLDMLAATNPNLKVFYTIDNPSKYWVGGEGYISKDMALKGLPAPSEDTLILVMGILKELRYTEQMSISLLHWTTKPWILQFPKGSKNNNKGLAVQVLHHRKWVCTAGFIRRSALFSGRFHPPEISWMEKFVRKGTKITAPVPISSPRTTGLGGFEAPSSKGDTIRSDESNLNVGVLHLVPSLEVFPLLADPKTYEPNTIDLAEPNELQYWFTVLSEHLPDLVDKAVASEGGTDDARRRGDAFARAFSAHLARENEASLAVLPDLLMELDSMSEETRLLTLIEGALAANIFDWGSRACVDDSDAFKERMGFGDTKPPRHKRALLFVDNAGADVVLGMLPLARELLHRGTEVSCSM
ncbi:hypothetical protein L2E82_35840 [Cichorium intybus]|uniref:Uncharacterized protein n=1 Tax=Cichorium intybus TaxID=13427 RepID=A0ACB9BQ28_CICIN|nr:hypothetical protein L2E82_35840 [Cichorium intybus]